MSAPKPEESILFEAHKIIYGDREETYGTPDKNLSQIAEYWNVFIHAKSGINPHLTAEDVCLMMVLLKLARLQNSSTHRDSQVDICGYVALLNRVQGSRQNPATPPISL